MTIAGTGLANALQVKFGGVLGTIISDSDTQLVVASPAGVAGTLDVTVVTAGGTSGTTAADRFTYVTGCGDEHRPGDWSGRWRHGGDD